MRTRAEKIQKTILSSWERISTNENKNTKSWCMEYQNIRLKLLYNNIILNSTYKKYYIILSFKIIKVINYKLKIS